MGQLFSVTPLMVKLLELKQIFKNHSVYNGSAKVK